MKLRWSRLRDSARSSLWFIPTVCVTLAYALAEGALQVDKRLDQQGGNWFLFSGGVESARAIMTTIATSMLTFTGLVFTITILVLQLASSQLSPRVMRTFLRDRATQIVLGVFIATFVYSLMVLRRITSVFEADPFVPALSVWLALLLVLLSIGLFIYYIHHMAQSIRPVSVMGHIAIETREAIGRLYPDGVGETAGSNVLPGGDGTVSTIVLAARGGVLTGIDEDRILRVAKETNCIIELRATVGDFVRDGSELFRIRGKWDGKWDKALQDSIGFGPERTMGQDAAFGFRQLVDIAERALSPGINDPTTAVQAIDHIHELLGLLSVRAIPSPPRDVDGKLALILPRPGWEEYVALGCDEIRRSGGDQMQIQRRLRAMLNDLLTIVPDQRRPPLEEQLKLLDAQLDGAFVGPERMRAATPSAQGQGHSLRG